MKKAEFNIQWDFILRLVLSFALFLVLLVIIVGIISLIKGDDEKIMKSNFEALTNSIQGSLLQYKTYYLESPNPFFQSKNYYIIGFNQEDNEAVISYGGKNHIVYRPSTCFGTCLCLYNDDDGFDDTKKKDDNLLICKRFGGINYLSRIVYPPIAGKEEYLITPVEAVIRNTPEGLTLAQFSWATTRKFLNSDRDNYRYRVEKIRKDGKTYVSVALYSGDPETTKIYDKLFEERKEFLEKKLEKSSEEVAYNTESFILVYDKSKREQIPEYIIKIEEAIEKNPISDGVPKLNYQLAILKYLYADSQTAEKKSLDEYAEAEKKLSFLIEKKSEKGYADIDFKDVESKISVCRLYLNKIDYQKYVLDNAEDTKMHSVVSDYAEYVLKARKDASKAIEILIYVEKMPNMPKEVHSKILYLYCLAYKDLGNIEKAKLAKEKLLSDYPTSSYADKVSEECVV